MPTEPRRPRRQTKALLAGGMVLGLGAAATLASWSDSINVSAAFSSGTFGIELNVDGEWNDVREMTFNADQMYPGAVAYAPVLVRTTDASDLGTQLALSGNGAPGLFMNALSYRVVSNIVPEPWAPTGEGSPPACDEVRFSGEPNYVLGSSGAAAPMSEFVRAESPQHISAAGADYAAYCFEVTLALEAPSGVQGDEAAHTWTWDAVSVSAEGTP